MKEFRVSIDKKEKEHLNKLNINNLESKDDKLLFYTDKASISKLFSSIEKIEYTNVYRQKLLRILKKHLISVIFLFLISFLLIYQNKSFVKIRFVNYNTYDQEVKDHLENFIVKKGPFFTLNDSILNINKNLKVKFYYYEWISVKKTGSFLDVDIKKLDKYEYQYVDNQIVGNFYSKYDGIVKITYVQKGVVLVSINQSVMKGDLIVSGNRKYHIGGDDYIKPKGVIIGEVTDYKHITIPKTKEITIRTGKVEIDKKIIINNKYKKKIYENENIVFKNIINLKYFKLSHIYHYEVMSFNIKYELDEAKELAIQDIKSKTYDHELEKLISFDLLNVEEDENNFYLKFIVKEYLNLCEFQPLINV